MSKKDPQYFTVDAKKSLNLMIDAGRSMRIYGATVKVLVEKYDSENWSSTPIPDYMDGYLNAKVLRDFIDKRIKEPSKMAIEYMKANNFDGLFLTKEELQIFYSLIQGFEESKEYISKSYGVSTMLN